MKNKEREKRIHNEIIVDCYDEDEQKMGWYYYMEEKLHFPFKAKFILRKRDGAETKQAIDVVQLSSDEGFGNDMLVGACYNENIFDVPLLSLLNIEADKETIEAIEDWRYWNPEKS